MPATDVIYYCDIDGSVPVLDWLVEVAKRDRRAVAKCAAQIEILGQMGRELRRPAADFLRDGIYELRIRSGRVQYRILYFFHAQDAVVLAHGLIKERAVPIADIERAVKRSKEFRRNPARHTYREEA